MTRTVISDEGPGRIINAQIMRGQNAAYVPLSNGTNVTVNAAQTTLLSLVYTPPVDCWWDVDICMALIQKLDAAYNYVQPVLKIAPADVDAITSQTFGIFVGHSAVNNYGSLNTSYLFKLAAGTQYTASVTIGTNGGTWQYYQSPAHLWLQAKAVSR